MSSTQSTFVLATVLFLATATPLAAGEAGAQEVVCPAFKSEKLDFDVAVRLDRKLVPLAAAVACAEVRAVRGARANIYECRMNCAADCPNAAERAQLKQAAENRCDQECRAKGTCPEGQTCVFDRFAGTQVAPTCLDPGDGCAAPNPALCVGASFFGNCRCVCVKEM